MIKNIVLSLTKKFWSWSVYVVVFLTLYTTAVKLVFTQNIVSLITDSCFRKTICMLSFFTCIIQREKDH